MVEKPQVLRNRSGPALEGLEQICTDGGCMLAAAWWAETAGLGALRAFCVFPLPQKPAEVSSRPRRWFSPDDCALFRSALGNTFPPHPWRTNVRCIILHDSRQGYFCFGLAAAPSFLSTFAKRATHDPSVVSRVPAGFCRTTGKRLDALIVLTDTHARADSTIAPQPASDPAILFLSLPLSVSRGGRGISLPGEKPPLVTARPPQPKETKFCWRREAPTGQSGRLGKNNNPPVTCILCLNKR